jgi:MFS family permease
MSAVTVLFVPFMLRDLGASTLVVGFVRTAQTIGMLAGAALLAGPGSRWSPARVLVWGVAGLGPCLALMGLASHWMALVPLLAAIGLCSSAMQAGTVTLLQRAVPDHARGRAESTFDTLLMGVMLVAMAGAGFFGDRFGARAVFLSAGALAVIAGFVGRSSLGLGRRAVREPWIAEETIIGEPGSR